MTTTTAPVGVPTAPETLEALTTQRETTDDETEMELVRRATELLESHPHFRGRSQWVYCRCSSGNLLLLGVVPSYYLKQLAQEAIRELSGVQQIVNRIRVVGPYSCMRPEPKR